MERIPCTSADRWAGPSLASSLAASSSVGLDLAADLSAASSLASWASAWADLGFAVAEPLPLAELPTCTSFVVVALGRTLTVQE